MPVPAGKHSITATYGGDAFSAGSVSTILDQVVHATNTSTTLTASPNPSTIGQSVTFTVTVTNQQTPVIANQGKTAIQATGTVTIYDVHYTDGTGYTNWRSYADIVALDTSATISVSESTIISFLFTEDRLSFQ